MTTSRLRPRRAQLMAAAWGVALTCVAFTLFRGLGRDHVLYGLPALVMLVLLCLDALEAPQGRSYAAFLAGVALTAVILRLAVGVPL